VTVSLRSHTPLQSPFAPQSSFSTTPQDAPIDGSIFDTGEQVADTPSVDVAISVSDQCPECRMQITRRLGLDDELVGRKADPWDDKLVPDRQQRTQQLALGVKRSRIAMRPAHGSMGSPQATFVACIVAWRMKDDHPVKEPKAETLSCGRPLV
jgi:hypothetical protein